MLVNIRIYSNKKIEIIKKQNDWNFKEDEEMEKGN